MTPGVLVLDTLVQWRLVSGTVELCDPDGPKGFVDGTVSHPASEAHLAASHVGGDIVPVRAWPAHLTPHAIPAHADFTPHCVSRAIGSLDKSDVKICTKNTVKSTFKSKYRNVKGFLVQIKEYTMILLLFIGPLKQIADARFMLLHRSVRFWWGHCKSDRSFPLQWNRL